jgi:hypothetical protein
MDPLAEKLDARLRQWPAETAAEVRERVAELIELADQGRRTVEQEVLDILDRPATRAPALPRK